MLQLTWIDFLLRNIPEMLILLWGIHIISKTPINKKNYIIISLTLAILTFYVRQLPIYFGVHMVINIILMIVIVVMIGIPIIKAIYSTLLLTFILSLSEFINMIMLNLFKINTNSQFLNPIKKCILFIPSLGITIIFIIIIRYLLEYKKDI